MLSGNERQYEVALFEIKLTYCWQKSKLNLILKFKKKSDKRVLRYDCWKVYLFLICFVLFFGQLIRGRIYSTTCTPAAWWSHECQKKQCTYLELTGKLFYYNLAHTKVYLKFLVKIGKWGIPLNKLLIDLDLDLWTSLGY